MGTIPQMYKQLQDLNQVILSELIPTIPNEIKYSEVEC